MFLRLNLEKKTTDTNKIEQHLYIYNISPLRAPHCRKAETATGFPVTDSYTDILQPTAIILYKKPKIGVGDVKYSRRKPLKNRVGA